ncbi:MAG: hypothetical protein KGN77_02105 [Xanthomonadaceae bacterium]|nr:hypothetical protein [Xanthomonadaceae bacterium]
MKTSGVSRETCRDDRLDLLARAANDTERRAIVNATPQTVRNLQRDSLDLLLERGSITGMEFHVARQIRRVWLAVTAALLPGNSMKSILGGGGGGGTRDWPAELSALHQQHYLPWTRRASTIAVAERISLTDLVFMIAVDGYGLRQAAERVGRDQRTVLRLFKHGLALFAAA